MPCVTLCVTDLRCTAKARPTRSVQNGMRRGATHDN
ncbi:hydrogenase expression protein [Pseudomonas syringae pv. actinidifoliorum]|nr:hydrogenase expression protein [Pseudomonas syringae pv. actinidifoliorum]